MRPRSPRMAAVTALFPAWVLVAAMYAPSDAADVSIHASRVIVTDKQASSGSTKVKLTAKDTSAGITKGSGIDPADISVTFTYGYANRTGSYVIPAGAFDGSGGGWQTNSTTTAKYLNKNAKRGTPTGTGLLQIKEGKQIRFVGKAGPDSPLDLVELGNPGDPVTVVITVYNGGEIHRHCSAFAPADVSFKPIAGGTGRKLLGRNGTPAECPDALGELELSPAPTFPVAPAAPYLWFDGTDAADLAELAARVIAPETSAFFASFRAVVDGALAGLATANDDTRARVAKAAALLEVLGESPPGGSGYASYRDVTLAAFDGLMDRTGLDSLDELSNPPANLLNVLQDSGRLQSLAEAYDLLRGSGVDAATDTTIRDLIATWADSFREDWNLIGDGFGVFEGHRDNWAVKGGSALVTTALTMPEHPSAPGWMASGYVFINQSLSRVVADPGWYAESPHYVNYSLNNLVSTAWHMRNAAGVDWFDDLAELIDVALATRQPNGEAAPFEEGIANAFPHDVLASAYPARAANMLWAWNNSSQDPVNYDNQQIHSVTRFLTVDRLTAPAIPVDPPTSFLTGNANIAVLRSGWDAGATQLTMMTAVDHSDSELVPSRHNTENPMDVVLFGAGATLLPTSSGGPTVTSSANRTYYLEPDSKNVPLVNGDAPYVTDGAAIDFSGRVDSRDEAGHPHAFADMATASVSGYASGSTVARTVALIDGDYAVVADRFASGSAATHEITWRGRGDSSVRASAADHRAADYAWPDSVLPTAHLAVDVTASTALTASLVAGFYAPSWGVDETLDPLRVTSSSTDTVMLSLLRPRLDTAPSMSVSPATAGGVPAFTVSDGAFTDIIAAGNGGTGYSVAGVTTDAELAVVRHESGATTGAAMSAGTSLDAGSFGGTVSTSATASLALTLDTGVIVASVAEDTTAPFTLTLSALPGINGGAVHTATFDGIPLTGPDFVQSGTTLTVAIPGGGALLIEESP